MKKLAIYFLTWGLFWGSVALMGGKTGLVIWGNWKVWVALGMMIVAFKLREWLGKQNL